MALDYICALTMMGPFAPLAQLDRASDFESEGRRFESYGVRQPSVVEPS